MNKVVKREISIRLRIIFLVLLISLAMTKNVHSQSYSVKRQSVNMKIEKGYFFVSGMYFISGLADEKLSITFPFPYGATYGEIDSLHIYDVIKSEFLVLEHRDRKSVRFSIEFDRTGEDLIQLYFRIKLLGNKAEYPFSKEEPANKIEKACFYLIAPTDLEASRFNYIPQDTIDAGLNVVYYWEFHDFSPNKDFEFRFR